MKIKSLTILSILLLTMGANAQIITKIELKNVDDRVSEGHQFTISTSSEKASISIKENAYITNHAIGTSVGASISEDGEHNALIIYQDFTGSSSSDDEKYLKLDGSSISTSADVTNNSFVASIDHSWKLITETRETDNVTINFKRIFNVTKTKNIGNAGDMVCFKTGYVSKLDMVFGFWGSIRTKELFFMEWNLLTDKLTSVKVADSFGGKVVVKGSSCFYNKTDAGGNIISAHIYNIFIDGLQVEIDAKLPLPKGLEIQDYTYSYTDGYTAVYLSENQYGNGVISIVNISEDDNSCVIRSFDELKPNLWTGTYSVGNPTHTKGGIFLNPNSGTMMEHNVLITQEQTKDGDYLILLRPKSGITSYPCGSSTPQFFSQVPTIVSIDNKTLKTNGWDIVNTYKQNYYGGGYLNDYSFTDFYSKWVTYTIIKGEKIKKQKVYFTQLPKYNTYEKNTLFCSAYLETGVDRRRSTAPAVQTKKFSSSPKKQRVVTVNSDDVKVEGYTYDDVDSESAKYNLNPVHKKGRYGYVDKDDNEIVPVHLVSVGKISDGMIKVYNGRNYGFYNTEGKLVIPLILTEASDFKNGHAIVTEKFKGKCKASKDGKLEKITTYSNSAENDYDPKYNLKHVEKDGKHGYVDKDNNVIVPIRFSSVGEIIDGMIKVEYKGKYGFYNVEGKRVISFVYYEATDFKNGYAIVTSSIGDKYKAYKDGSLEKIED